MEDGIVRLADGATVNITGIPALQFPPVSQQKPTTKDGHAVQRTVRVFNSVAFNGNDEVVTGWKHASGDAKTPQSQYCYYAQLKTTGVVEQINLARADSNGQAVFDPQSSSILGNAASNAATKCVWWSPSAQL